MDNEQEKLMVKKLLRNLYKNFWIGLIIYAFIIGALLVLLITGFANSHSQEDSFLIFIYFIILAGSFVLAVVGLEPIIKDLRYLKSHKPMIIIGRVAKYRKVIHHGDPDTINYYPTIRDIDHENIEVEVKAEKTELNKTYYCIYLPNTKFAVCEEIIELNK